MIRLAAAVLIAALARGQEPSPRAAELVEKLRSESVAERDAATRRLAEMGEAARADLERATGDSDPEVAARARQVLRNIDIRAGLTPALLRALPGLPDRLSGNDEHAWTEAFLEATEQKGVRRKHPGVARTDVEPLARRALKGAEPGEWGTVIRTIAVWRLRSAAPDLVPFLTVDHPQAGSTRGEAELALGSLGTPDLVPAILEAARNASPPYRKTALLKVAARIDPPSIVKELPALLYPREGAGDSSRMEPLTLARALEHSAWAVILEDGRLRAVDPAEAPALWAAWWEKESGGK